MEKRITSLLKELVNIESITGNEPALVEFLSRRLEGSGYRITRQEIASGRQNLLAVLGTPRILFCTHTDTVAPFLPFSSDGKILRGRGTCDAKGSMAAMLIAGEKLAAEGRRDVGFLFVTGEETSSDGAKKAGEMVLDTEYIILGEPTDNLIASSQKGTLVFRVTVEGLAGHSALPSSGRSAVHKMAAIIKGWLDTDWGSDPSRGENTLNIGTVRGGIAPNVIAPGCVAEGIFRVATSVEDVRNIMTREIDADADIEVEILSSSEPLDLTRVPGLEHTVVSFGSDAPYLSGIARVIMCGPGSIRFAHSEDEQISVGELLEGVDVYKKIASNL
jgi:acetylornithine deacetylase